MVIRKINLSGIGDRMEDISYKLLVKEIEITRKDMIFAGVEYGLTDLNTVKLSQRLDQLLNHLSCCLKSNPTSFEGDSKSLM